MTQLGWGVPIFPFAGAGLPTEPPQEDEEMIGTIVRRTTNSVITNNTDLHIRWNNTSPEYDDAGFWQAGTTPSGNEMDARLTADITGWYTVWAQITWQDTWTGWAYCWAAVNTSTGVASRGKDHRVMTGTQVGHIGFSAPIFLTAGDYLRLFVRQNSGANQSVAATDTRFGLTRTGTVGS